MAFLSLLTAIGCAGATDAGLQSPSFQNWSQYDFRNSSAQTMEIASSDRPWLRHKERDSVSEYIEDEIYFEPVVELRLIGADKPCD